jgi:hypothetical protein
METLFEVVSVMYICRCNICPSTQMICAVSQRAHMGNVHPKFEYNVPLFSFRKLEKSDRLTRRGSWNCSVWSTYRQTAVSFFIYSVISLYQLVNLRSVEWDASTATVGGVLVRHCRCVSEDTTMEFSWTELRKAWRSSNKRVGPRPRFEVCICRTVGVRHWTPNEISRITGALEAPERVTTVPSPAKRR